MKQEGYEAEEASDIAHRFLHHARYETGLLAERGLGQFGCFHLTFEEYLAAREMARQRVEKRREMLRAQWEDPRWHEVILLSAGQLGIVEAKKDDVSDLLVDLLEMEPRDPEDAGRQVVLAGRALADIGPRSVTRRTGRWVLEALRETMQDRDPETKRPNDPPRIPVRTRYAAGEVLDELGWLPDDLHAWVRCSGIAEDGGDLLVMKYPVTNAQFEHFIQADGYENPPYWGGAGSEGWQWRLTEHPSYRGEDPVTEPEYWHDPRFGKERRGYPVVGVSWYEATAYAAWLMELLGHVRHGDPDLLPEDRDLVADLLETGATEVRLPTEGEWERMAGGVADKDRYPWDPPRGPATRDEAAVLARVNTRESDIRSTSLIAMYPLGASQPFGLMDLAGNVWEWTATEEGGVHVLRGGSWLNNPAYARCVERLRYYPNHSSNTFGFRLVSPV
jgi:formylglycine-generating enzyme required for sulfatase activity